MKRLCQMTLLGMTSFPLATIRAATPAPGVPSPDQASSAPPLPEIRDIAPPVDFFPYPTWMLVSAAVLAGLLLALLIGLLVRWIRNRPAPAPLSARDLAMRQLESLRTREPELEPYAFSVEVSDVLRRFVGGHFGLSATRQTSPEFLASLSNSDRFSEDDRLLLASFLEKCDLIKFARLEASHAESQQLLGSALAFTRGARVLV
jgi:Domain of unknown function (DUF4381)